MPSPHRGSESFGAAIGDLITVCDTKHQAFFPAQTSVIGFEKFKHPISPIGPGNPEFDWPSPYTARITRPLAASMQLKVCRAIMRSSSMGITHTSGDVPFEEMSPFPFWFPFSSSVMPSRAAFVQTRLRISDEFSPIPAVNTSASNPPSVAVKAPSS